MPSVIVGLTYFTNHAFTDGTLKTDNIDIGSGYQSIRDIGVVP